MKFEMLRDDKIQDNKIVYYTKDRSFDCSVYVNTDISIVVAYLNIGIDSIDMCIKHCWGFSPVESWQPRNLSVPLSQKGRLRLIDECEPGFSYRIDEGKEWKSYYDKSIGWYCVGDYKMKEEDIAVDITSNMIAVIDKNSHLKSIWIHPTFI